jgi:hypothetical protein
LAPRKLHTSLVNKKVKVSVKHTHTHTHKYPIKN